MAALHRGCLALAVCLLPALCAAQPSAIERPLSTSVRPGINDNYLDPDLNPDEWIAKFEVESREVFRARHEIAEACGLKPGETIGDIGAGTGLFTMIFAEQVGPKGRVHAVDIASKFVDLIRANARAKGLPQVEATVVGDHDPIMPFEQADCVFVCDVYHHFEFPSITNRALFDALKPGGRLVVVDFERVEGQSSDFVMGHVRAGKSEFRAEIEAAGFEFLDEPRLQGLKENYCLRFRRPAAVRKSP